MGAVYDVNMNIKVNSRKGVIETTKNFINCKKGKVRFFPYGDFRSFIGAIKMVITDRNFNVIQLDKDAYSIQSGFDASYGWESIMVEWFRNIGKYLDDNSEFSIYPDTGKRYLVVRNGIVIEV